MRRRLDLGALCLVLAFGVLAAAVTYELERDDAIATRSPVAAKTPTPVPTPGAALTPEPTTAPVPAAGEGLAIGVTEFNANLITPAAAKPLEEPWNGVRDRLAAIQPQFFRFVIDWASVQPTAEMPANMDSPQAGCMREVGPCLGWGGIREQLSALAARQREGGWQALAVVTSTPDWAASPPAGCERGRAIPRARPPRADALPAYRALVAAVLATAAEVGAQLTYWSPWNEPNHPAFISPQREDCDPASPSLAPAGYTQIASELRQTLDTAPGEQRLVIGETAGLMKPTRYVTAVPEFIAGLPRDLVCATTVWSQHAYIGGEDPVAPAAEALAKFGCPQPHTIWITETGVGPAPRDLSAGGSIADARAGCRALQAQLVRWWKDPRVTVAIQYTVREDDKFPVGLVSTDLLETRPSLAVWTAWGGGRAPNAPPPPSACGT